MSTVPIRVVFVDPSLSLSLEKLELGTFEEKQLAKWIRRAIEKLSMNPKCGIRIPSALWPKVYIQQYGITNLWKIDFPMGWRMTYTLRKDELDILGIILEWYNHPHYERKYGY